MGKSGMVERAIKSLHKGKSKKWAGQRMMPKKETEAESEKSRDLMFPEGEHSKYRYRKKAPSGRVYKKRRGTITKPTAKLKTPKKRDKKIVRDKDFYYDKALFPKKHKKPRRI